METPWRIPDIWVCFSPPVLDIDIGTLPALANGYITFGSFNNLTKVTDRTVAAAVRVAMKQMDTMANSDYVIPESTPDKSALGTGREPDQTHIQQFGSGSLIDRVDVGA